MRLNTKYLIVAIALIMGGMQAKAQQLPVLNQYIYNPFLYNPARAGQGDGDLYINFRKQWDKFPYSPITNILSFNMPVLTTNMGVGATLFMDKAHLQRTTGGMVAYAYHIPFNTEKTHRLSIGIGAGLIHQKFDFQDAEVVHPTDPTIFDEASGAVRFDMSAGINYQFKGLNVGFAVPQLIKGNLQFRDNTQAEEVEVGLERHYYAFASYRHGFGKEKNLYLEPVFALRKVTAIPMQYDMNIIFDYKRLAWVSGGYRTANKFTQDAGVNVAAGFSIKQKVSATYTFETVIGKDDRSAFGNSHEVMLGFHFGRDNREIENRLKDVETNTLQNTEDIAELREDVDSLKEAVDEAGNKVDSLANKVDDQSALLNEAQNLIQQNNQAVQAIKQYEEQKMVFKKMGSVYFPLDSYVLGDEAKANLKSFAETVKGYQGDLIFYVAGSASEEGASDYNLILALRRAAAVKAYMKELGLRGEVLVMTYGEEAPEASDLAKNRRADIYVTGQQ